MPAKAGIQKYQVVAKMLDREMGRLHKKLHGQGAQILPVSFFTMKAPESFMIEGPSNLSLVNHVKETEPSIISLWPFQ
jgi:hypothetical protein